MGKKEDNAWHLEKKVPLGIIFTMIAQTIGLAVWFTQLDGRVTAVEAQTSAQQEIISRMREDQTAMTISLTRIEARQENSLETLKEINRALSEPKGKSK